MHLLLDPGSLGEGSESSWGGHKMVCVSATAGEVFLAGQVCFLAFLVVRESKVGIGSSTQVQNQRMGGLGDLGQMVRLLEPLFPYYI